ncbi:hypothetical protein PHISCL_01294 [Aspergillus sclerotialis]|uniref:Uncharacterized protein n=1 Tax=Aspergillus sclerotialis TaxID=2070753 RepID=A0A3A2ZYF5_9EURO|nr:hypothetical protein PHISCL_01294 [Aspergillus sclerotialis]
MATYELNQSVSPGNLILIYNSMTPSSIYVKRVEGHIPEKAGFWTLSGPEVYYINKSESAPDYDERLAPPKSDDDESDHDEPILLANIIEGMAARSEANENDKYQDANVVVKPHGREFSSITSEVIVQNVENQA